jgi:hypothetical protein
LRGSAWGREREAGGDRGESRGRRPPSRGTYLRDVGDQDRGGVGDDAEEGVAGVARRGGRRRGGEERRASLVSPVRWRRRGGRSGEWASPAERSEWIWSGRGREGEFWLSPQTHLAIAHL